MSNINTIISVMSNINTIISVMSNINNWNQQHVDCVYVRHNIIIVFMLDITLLLCLC
jgi:hypothetical protein